jgi:hypothetical protein
VEGASHRAWLIGDEQRAFFAEGSSAPGRSLMATIFARDLVHGGDSELPGLIYPIAEIVANVSAALDPDALYLTTYYDNVTIARLPLGGGPKRMLSNLPSCSGAFELRGENVYWQCNQRDLPGDDAYRFVVGRNGVAAGSAPQTLVSLPSKANERGVLSVLPQSLVYFFSLEGRLFELSL